MDNDDEGTEDLQALLDDVRARAEDIVRSNAHLLSEYQQLNDSYLKHRSVFALPGLKALLFSVKAEHAAAQQMLEELRSRSYVEDGHASGHLDTLEDMRVKLTCPNVFSLSKTWDIVKRCRGLEQLTGKFSLHASAGPCHICRGHKKCPPKGKQDSKSLVHVDAVVSGGAEWLRIIGIDQRRLLHEMAEMGWDWGAPDESDGDGDDCDVPVAVAVRQLVAAARANRHNYRPPRLHIVFPRVAEGGDPEVDRLIRMLRSVAKQGVEIQIDCSNSEFLTAPPPSLDTALQNLVAEDMRSIASTVNLDCSILVALASDITHSNVEVQPWHRRDLRFQITQEIEIGGSLVKALYPVLQSRKLVCTKQAAERFWDIVQTIATKAEAARAELILPRKEISGSSREELVAELQNLSIHPVEPALRLPIEVIESDALDGLTTTIEAGRLPRSANFIYPELAPLNRDIFFYGWLNQVTTITANNSLAKKISLLVEEHRTSDDETGPKLWVFPYTRALATKGRKGGSDIS